MDKRMWTSVNTTIVKTNAKTKNADVIIDRKKIGY